jgi:hypothetical protein
MAITITYTLTEEDKKEIARGWNYQKTGKRLIKVCFNSNTGEPKIRYFLREGRGPTHLSKQDAVEYYKKLYQTETAEMAFNDFDDMYKYIESIRVIKFDNQTWELSE